MNLAFGIFFLWSAAALFFVAFHPLHLESARGVPGDVVHSLQSSIQDTGSAYSL
jgi:hypothetical protein